MTLIKSISGIRGTIGGRPGDNLTPVDLIAFTSAFADWVKTKNAAPTVVIGRDGRVSGAMVKSLVVNTLIANGVHVIDLDYSTTPTVEMYVPFVKADAGIILTASHNPKEWNALKFLNHKGEFISSEEGQSILDASEKGHFNYAGVEELGKVEQRSDAISYHIKKILELPLVNAESIKAAKFKVVVDCINSTGALSIPPLLDALGVSYELINAEINGEFAHNPEPLAEHLTELSSKVRSLGAHMGIVVDPDVDRLAFVSEDGSMFGEEYTLVAVADYILRNTPGPTVSNLSSTLALKDLTESTNNQYYTAAVGEVNVVTKMKSVNAVIGGEGNGGVIYPELHYGRDALVGIALFLNLLAEDKVKLTKLRARYPAYFISKNKITLNEHMNVDEILRHLQEAYAEFDIDTSDGIKINMPGEWVQLRKSNTEPIIRVYSESDTEEKAKKLADDVRKKVAELAK